MQEADERQSVHTAREWIVRLASGRMTADELRRLKAWLAEDAAHRRAFDEARTLWHRLGPLEGAMERLLAEDRRQAAPASTLPDTRFRRVMFGAGIIAAGLASIMLSQDIRILLWADHRTSVGQQQVVSLPDGGRAYLNTDTAIALSYTAHERRIELLRGEALFEVAPDRTKPFRVHAQGGVTQAIGTAFAVHAQERETRVTVTRGIVSVSTAHGRSTDPPLEIVRDQQTVYRQGESPQAPYAVESETAVAWTNGTIVIQGRPFTQAMAELNRYRRGRIVVLADEARTKPVSGRFTLRGIDEAVTALAATQHLRVVRLTDYLLLVM